MYLAVRIPIGLLLLPLEMTLLVAMCVMVSGVTHPDQIPRRSQSDIVCLCRWLVEDNVGDVMPSWG